MEGLSAYNVGDYATAYSIWLPLAKQGNANSQSAIGYLFYDGRGVGRNRGQAARWYQRAADQGEPTAQFFLCEMHMRGDGVPRDLKLSLMWCELAIRGGEIRATHARERAMRQMTTEQRDLAWQLITRWSERRARRSPSSSDAGTERQQPEGPQ
jgi:TPR repeat protein